MPDDHAPAEGHLGNAIPPAEWDLRVQLAAAYRLVDHHGWTEQIYGHLTARVPGPEDHFLINPWGLNYDEVTASNLVKIDLDGCVVDRGEQRQVAHAMLDADPQLRRVGPGGPRQERRGSGKLRGVAAGKR